VDGHGHLFIADRNNKRIRKVDAATGVITTVAGNGNGYFGTVSGTAAGFKNLSAIAVDGAGNILVADTGTQLVRRLDVTTNLLAPIAGNGQTGIDGVNGDGGSALNARLNNPQGLAVDAFGNVYVAESGGPIRRIDVNSGVIVTVAGTGALTSSRGVAIDEDGRLVVADLL